jgi:hypothetical protein
MGKKHLIGNQHNLFWDLGDSLGNEFEDKVYTILSNELSPYFNLGLRIEQTPRSNDGGKDIIITSPIDIESLFGIYISKKGKDTITIHVECKSTNYPNLRYEKIIPSAVKNKRKPIDYFILVTNSEILPYTYYLVKEELPENIEFVLIDQFILAKALKSKYSELFGDIPIYDKKDDDFYGEYQIVSVGDFDENNYEIYFLFRNYSQKVQSCSLSLVSDINWMTDKNSVQFMVDPNKSYSKMIYVSSEFHGGLDTLAFRITKNQNEDFIYIDGTNLNEHFAPKFIGADHKKIKNIIINSMTEQNNNKLHCLWGVSGIGKTRIIQEIIKEIRGTNFNIFKCSLKNNNIDSIVKLFKFLRMKKLTDEPNCSINLLSDTIKNSKNNYLRTLIIIDDFHYAKIELINEIKNLIVHDKPIFIVIAGRTDYSFGNLDYYNFVEWSRNNIPKGCLHDVKPLETEDTIRLIKSIINKIPDSALDTLVDKSMNNPLYIIQYVEYLIGEKLVYIVNKNTVSIDDASSFNSKKYIPEGIVEIYKRRINNLESESNEFNNFVEFLYILSVYDGEIKKSTALRLYDEEYNVIPHLINRCFIIQENDSYRFIHESLFLYIKEHMNSKIKKKIASLLISKLILPEIGLSDYILGRLFIWNNMYSEARQKFLPIIQSTKKYTGISNLNVDMTTYEFLYDVYEAFKKDIAFKEEIKTILNTRIYITLHHLIPFNAVEECDYCLSLTSKSNLLRNDKKFVSSIISQKAHALLNSGKNTDGQLVLHELQSMWLASSENLESKTLFDVMDRLSAIYIKLNCHEIAENYNNLSISVAEKSNSYSNIAIAYRTRSKLFYLNEYQKCEEALNKVDDILSKHPAPRIKINNEIYRATLCFSYNKFDDFDEIINKVALINQESLDKKYNRATIQSLMLLSAIYLKRGRVHDLKVAKGKATRAIDYSVKFGIPSYMWQLYNLLGIISTKTKENIDDTRRYFETVYSILDSQGLLYLGYKNICYSNILAISNIGFFWRKYDSESFFNEKFSKIKYYGKEKELESNGIPKGKITNRQLIELYAKAKNGKILFSNDNQINFLRDDETGYFIALT